MTECEKINDMFCDYLNGKLSKSENYMVINHLATCKNCVAEIATLIRIKNIEQKKLKSIPQDILSSAFDRIPDKEIAESPFSIAFDSIYNSMRIIKQTIRFATQVI